MKLLLVLIFIAAIAWTIFFFTHQDTLCRMWWFSAEDWCIRYNTVNPR